MVAVTPEKFHRAFSRTWEMYPDSDTRIGIALWGSMFVKTLVS